MSDSHDSPKPVDEFFGNDLSVGGLISLILERRWRLVGVTVPFTILAIIYAVLATPIYRSNILLAPAEEMSIQSSLLSQLGGLASVAGVSVGGDSSAEPLAVLTSRGFTHSFIEDFNLLPVFFSDDWDEASASWNIRNEKDIPDLRDGFKFFDENVRTVSEDRRTGMVTVTIEWKDAEVAAAWANVLIDRLNRFMREKAIAEAEENIEFLKNEMNATNVAALEQSIASLLERELQKKMLAKGNEEFVYRVIDKAEPGRKPVKPRVVLIVFIATVFGGFVGLASILFSGRP